MKGNGKHDLQRLLIDDFPSLGVSLVKVNAGDPRDTSYQGHFKHTNHPNLHFTYLGFSM